MIKVTDLHGKEVWINAELIETVEANPDTQVMLTNGHRHYVKESPAEVASRVLDYRRECMSPEGRFSKTGQCDSSESTGK